MTWAQETDLTEANLLSGAHRQQAGVGSSVLRTPSRCSQFQPGADSFANKMWTPAVAGGTRKRGRDRRPSAVRNHAQGKWRCRRRVASGAMALIMARAGHDPVQV
ncbi:hypothetical protein ACU4GD_29145 [Cupriavidus basilensis]